MTTESEKGITKRAKYQKKNSGKVITSTAEAKNNIVLFIPFLDSPKLIEIEAKDFASKNHKMR